MSFERACKVYGLEPLLNVLILAAQETSRETRRYIYNRRRRRYHELRAGVDTPLWNELVRLAARLLVKHGDKSNLARFLGVPRQRVHKLLVEKSAVLDGERTLLLLSWVAVSSEAARSTAPARQTRRQRSCSRSDSGAPRERTAASDLAQNERRGLSFNR